MFNQHQCELLTRHLPSLMQHFYEAKINGQIEVAVWDSGKPKREFLHVDDMASASLFALEIDQSTSQKTPN